MIRENETHRFCNFCGKWITWKNWFSHRSSRTHMHYESKNEQDPRIQIYQKEEELAMLNIELKSADSYELMTFHNSLFYEFLQKEVSKNCLIAIKYFDNVKQNDSFVFNEKDTHTPHYFYFSHGHFQSLDENRNLYTYIFDIKHQNVIIYKSNRINATNNLTNLMKKVGVKEYVVPVFSDDEEYTDEARMRIFGKNMKNLRETVSNNITINDVLELENFKNFDYEKYEITYEGLKRIKHLLAGNFTES